MNEEQMDAVARLSPQQIAAIDHALLSLADMHWRKVAYLVGKAMSHPEKVPGIPDVFYAQRVARLVALGVLESEGNLDYMCYSEVRLRISP